MSSPLAPADLKSEAAATSTPAANDHNLHATLAGPAMPSSTTMGGDSPASTPTIIKQEQPITPRPSSPVDSPRPGDSDALSIKAVAALKTEHSMRVQSPLRESSVPVPTTELASTGAAPPPSNPKKRPAPGRTKKGTATTMKKAPPAKRRRLADKKDDTPAAKLAKANALGKGTPANSSPAPSARSYSADVGAEDGYASSSQHSDNGSDSGTDDPDADVYCICRRPDNGTFMIGCDGGCDDWFHGKCVGIPEGDKNLIDKYMCPNCTDAGVGRTSWKRICRRPGCRLPARTAKKKDGSPGSKYCSEECGVKFFRAMTGRLRGQEEGVGHREHRGRSAPDNKHSKAVRSSSPDYGARGGILAAGEVKALLDAAPTTAAFHALGSAAAAAAAVPSPPATPDAKSPADGRSSTAKPTADDVELNEQLAKIAAAKENARRRHARLKDRVRFVGFVKAFAVREAESRMGHSNGGSGKSNGKSGGGGAAAMKEFCGYDRRLEWSDAEWDEWRKSAEGVAVFAQEAIARTASPAGSPEGLDNDGESITCDRKRCLRHTDWPKLAIDSLRGEISENGDRMRALEGEEETLRTRALMRRVGRGEGAVERHGEPTGPSTLDLAQKSGELSATLIQSTVNGVADGSGHATPSAAAVSETNAIPQGNGQHLLQAPAQLAMAMEE